MDKTPPPRLALASYHAREGIRPALLLDGLLFDYASALLACEEPAGSVLHQSDVAELLAHWPQVEPRLTELARRAASPGLSGARLSAALDPAVLAAPFVPNRIFCAASNYIEHANEMGTALAAKAESKPYMFLKTATSVIGPNEAVRIPREVQKADWEVELAAVIGRTGRRVSTTEALELVAGYMVLNDVSARDLTRRNDYPFKHDWFQGKNHDTFCPIGPWIVPARALGDPQQASLSLTVNGETMQAGTAAEMIWTVAEQIAYLSTIVTLHPGDVVATGTPTGVGMGRGIFLKPGDIMVASVEGIGSIRNPVEAES
jgi:2,4-didehydro-3-deoxy-L-rhamnonate hydrolase